jgi:hypothetical protein
MNVFSKPLKHEEEILSYIDFFKNEIDISKLKLTELKNIARKNKFRISGSKEILKKRVYTFFLESKACSIIQKYFRGHLLRYSFKLRGPAFRHTEKCVNDSDFVSLDPLNEIEFHDFYSYQDSKGFIYGFSISSLMSLWTRKRTLTNPYNREEFDSSMVSNIHTLHRMKDIIFYYYKPQIKQPENVSVPSTITNSYRLSSHGIRIYQSNQSNILTFPNANNRELIERMQEIQQKPLNVRIQELFMEIDNLGNYTQASWFDNLTTSDYIRYLRYLGDIWNYRGQLSVETKRNICTLLDPFSQRFAWNATSRDAHENIQQVCVFVLEHMIYTGADIEYRKLGALHALSALTIVSIPARRNMIWLYESLLY